MTDEDKITQLEARIKQLESYLNQFESFKQYNQSNKKTTLPSVTKTTKSNGARTKGSRLPEDWLPSPDLLAWASKDFPCVDIRIETEKFIDYWLSRADKGAIKLSWDRTYRNWIRNASSQYRGKNETYKRTDKSDFTSSVRHAFD